MIMPNRWRVLWARLLARSPWPTGAVRMDVDRPRNHATVAGTLTITGWAAARRARIRKVTLLLPGRAPIPLRHGLPRPDVQAALPEFAAAHCGFDGRIRMRDLPVGRVRIVVVAEDEHGRLATCERLVRIAPAGIRYAPRVPSPERDALSLPAKEWPRVTLIIPVFNQLAYTERCLLALTPALPQAIPVEILIVDDASTDETPARLRGWTERLGNLRVLRNESNQGFIVSCNRGAEAASGTALVFLNNDTEPQPGFLPPLIHTLYGSEMVGAVGGKLLYPDGTLQEAGGVIYRDGGSCNFGNGAPCPSDPLYCHLRPVDYCSAALLATPRRLFLDVGGFDAHYRPAYYEDADYCFALRARGCRVMYQPESVVIHHEGGTDPFGQVKAHLNDNRLAFVEKWSEQLLQQPASPAEYDEAAWQRLVASPQTGARARRALLWQSEAPNPKGSREAQRAFIAAQLFQDRGFHVTIFIERASTATDIRHDLEQAGLLVYVSNDGAQDSLPWSEHAARLLAWSDFDVIVFGDCELHEAYQPLVQHNAARARVLGANDEIWQQITGANHADARERLAKLLTTFGND
ncbi:MAG: glycosyltransferase family 2 protein [Vicinamibacteria bacterium]|jgi:GT2 family glycosyltransferase|nr:glycosyltransferase family 2 protein [Vicinamibacteria bacterium]